jgi:HPt (histidine-containing phosphotransfer) domain-containing protein
MSTVSQEDWRPAMAPFDPTIMLARIGGNMELFAELVTIFDEDCPPLLDEIRQAIASNDADRLKFAAHTLCGAIGSFTTAPPYDLAKRLELEAETKCWSDTPKTLDLLADGVEQLSVALARYMSCSDSKKD